MTQLPAGATTATPLPFSGVDDPQGVAVDAAGNVYVTDRGNAEVFRLQPGARAAIPLSLGRFEVPVAVAALVWLLGAAFVSIVSAPTIVPILIVVGMLAIGGVYLAYLLSCRREVLDHEPGVANREKQSEPHRPVLANA